MKRIFLVALLFILTLLPTRAFALEGNYIKVKIGKNYSEKEEVTITSKSNIYVVDENFNKILDLNSSKVKVSLENDKLILKNKTIFSKDFDNKANLMLLSDDFLKIKNEYRGAIGFIVKDKKLSIINYLELEDYLKGVVPKEISASSPKDALKSQAVVARSFALSNINKYSKLGYNLDDTTACQVYGGKSAEEKSSNEAVLETKGIVVKHEGKVANTVYGSSSGGITADISEVWGGESCPYMVSKEDPYSVLDKWEYKINVEKLKDILSKNNIQIGSILDFKISEYDSSGRAKKILLIGSDGNKEITGAKLRSILGNTKFKSTLFNITNNGSDFVINGKGYGHGVGLSQVGAVEMAKSGFNYKEILNFYFPNTVVEDI
ncbi:SpoIID/LytB domain-containing protein [Peptoniphilus catoniae]|uniref:SpoIID/LytB domain-containing protein n=1 Tax=Peptoniphilus catoniae TaxID=1660341 RepID=UPI0010FD7489|nr:SpoIID/LytB domain-containing protein [Peptoniphilus catoniae]